MAAPQNSPEKTLVQAVIQRANAELKLRMGQPRAAARLFAISQRLCAEAFSRRTGRIMGWTPDRFDRLGSEPTKSIDPGMSR